MDRFFHYIPSSCFTHAQKVNRMKDRLLQIEPLRDDICRDINLSSSSDLIENLIETSVNGCRRIDRLLTPSEIYIPSDKTRGGPKSTFETNMREITHVRDDVTIMPMAPE